VALARPACLKKCRQDDDGPDPRRLPTGAPYAYQPRQLVFPIRRISAASIPPSSPGAPAGRFPWSPKNRHDPCCRGGEPADGYGARTPGKSGGEAQTNVGGDDPGKNRNVSHRLRQAIAIYHRFRAHSWNHLQDALGQLFGLVAGMNHWVALAIWYSSRSDRAEREMLRARRAAPASCH
jgi:hypothetical protein